MNVAFAMDTNHRRKVGLLAFDIDGTLTDARTWWMGPEHGWVQRYSVRDGEALLRMKTTGLPLVPLSINRTRAARERMLHLGLPTQWLGVSDKQAAITEVAREYATALTDICYVGDSLGDSAVFEQVGLSYAVADAHPEALRKANHVLSAVGGAHVMEEIEQLIVYERIA